MSLLQIQIKMRKNDYILNYLSLKVLNIALMVFLVLKTCQDVKPTELYFEFLDQNSEIEFLDGLHHRKNSAM